MACSVLSAAAMQRWLSVLPLLFCACTGSVLVSGTTSTGTTGNDAATSSTSTSAGAGGVGGANTTSTTNTGGSGGSGGSGGMPECLLDIDCLPNQTCMNGQCECVTGAPDDPDNCGVCGNKCLTGLCAEGACAGTLIASGLGQPTKIVVDASNVYWVEWASPGIYKADLQGGAPTLLPANDIVSDLALDSTYVYWAGQYHAAGKVPIAGGAPTILGLGTNAFALAVAPPNVYWLGWSQKAVLDTAPLDPIGPLTATMLYDLDPYHSAGIAADATSVYFTGYDVPSSTGVVLKMPLGGGAVTTLAAVDGRPGELLVDDTTVYFVRDGAIWTVPIEGGAVTHLTAGLSGKGDLTCLVRDANALYGTTYSRVWKIPLDGSPPVSLLPNVKSARCVAVDDQFIYWTDFVNSTVSKMAKQ